MTRVHVSLAVLLTIAAWIFSVAIYPSLPDEIPIHWNVRGEVDDYGSKTWATFLTPGIMVALLLLFWVLPWASPKQFEVEPFRSTYFFVMLLLIVFAAYVQGLIGWAALEGPLDTGRAIVGGVCLLFALLGNVLGKVRRNFWVGVRTPWTIASERVWNETHRLAARLFVAAGLIGFVLMLAGLSLPAMFITVMVLIFTAALVPVIYSLILYKRLQAKGEI